jgi:hypothetical protein
MEETAKHDEFRARIMYSRAKYRNANLTVVFSNIETGMVATNQSVALPQRVGGYSVQSFDGRSLVLALEDKDSSPIGTLQMFAGQPPLLSFSKP